MEIKIDETYHVARCCCPQYVYVVLGKKSLHHLSFIVKWQGRRLTANSGYDRPKTSTIFFRENRVQSLNKHARLVASHILQTWWIKSSTRHFNVLVNRLWKIQFWKNLFAIGFPYKHCNFWPLCLPVKMASKTVIRPISSLYCEVWVLRKSVETCVKRVHNFLNHMKPPIYALTSQSRHNLSFFFFFLASIQTSP